MLNNKIKKYKLKKNKKTQADLLRSTKISNSQTIKSQTPTETIKITTGVKLTRILEQSQSLNRGGIVAIPTSLVKTAFDGHMTPNAPLERHEGRPLVGTCHAHTIKLF